MIAFGETPKDRRLAAREERIIAAARALAEEHGWDAVTTRRLADTIEYSQPVLYGHFPQGKSQIVTAVALVGFDELATVLCTDAVHSTSGADRVRAIVTTYLDFAKRNPATYEAMFRLPIGAPFASADTPRSMSDGFDAIVGALRTLDDPPADLGTAAEVLWGAMHGVATLTTIGPVQTRAPSTSHRRARPQLHHLTSPRPEPRPTPNPSRGRINPAVEDAPHAVSGRVVADAHRCPASGGCGLVIQRSARGRGVRRSSRSGYVVDALPHISWTRMNVSSWRLWCRWSTRPPGMAWNSRTTAWSVTPWNLIVQMTLRTAPASNHRCTSPSRRRG